MSDTHLVPPSSPESYQEIDHASAYARTRMERRRRWIWPVVVVPVVGLVAFVAGRWFASEGPAQPKDGLSATTTQSAAPAKQLWTCSMHPQVIQPEPGICPICHMELTPLKSGGHGSELSIDPVIVQNMGVRVANVARGPIVQSVRAVGYLEEPEPLHRDINLRVNGWIEKLYADTDGMVISKGKPLFDLYSPELSIAIDELIAARKQVDRAGTDETANSLLESSRRKLLQFGLESEQVEQLSKLDAAPRTVPIISTMDGHLTAKMVYEGAAVKAGDLVLRLASRHQMWIDAQVPESQMPLISDGQPVRATLVSQPGKVFRGKVLFVHPHVDPQTRTALVRVEIDNADMSLRQGMYATVEILADAYREAPLIPREAVIDTGKRQVVFVALGEGRFEAREVTLGLVGQNDTVEVASGLRDGETVVISGQFLLDSESRLKDAVAKHMSQGLPGHTTDGVTMNDLRPSGSAPTTVPTERLTVPHAGDIVRAYLQISEKLGERQEADSPIDPNALIASATQAAQHSDGTAKELVTKVLTGATALRDKPLAEQRAQFVGVSEAVIELTRRASLTGEVPETLYVMHCPMVFEDRGANWMQSVEALANPYYATQMKKCGEVVERFETK